MNSIEEKSGNNKKLSMSHHVDFKFDKPDYNNPAYRKSNFLTPVAEVAPRLSFNDNDDETDSSSDNEHNHMQQIDEPTTSNQRRSMEKPTTAEIFVALSEKRRRSLGTTTNDTTNRKSASSPTVKRKNVTAEIENNIDPLRANLQILYECFNLIKRNQRQLIFNVFLILLVCLILTSMIVFAMFAPSKSGFELALTPWSTFWPLDMRLRLYQLGKSQDTLILSLGNSYPSFTRKPPSYCDCCTGQDDAPRCDHSDRIGTCWCFNWHSKAKLYLTSIDPSDTNTDCLLIEWRSTAIEPVDVYDCFYTSFNNDAVQVRWYGGVLTADQKWPLNANISLTSFESYTVNDIRSDSNGFYGIAQPIWISDNGFAVIASLDYPFLVNRSDSNICLKSIDISKSPLRYMICKADDTRTFTWNISTLNRYVSTYAQNLTAIEKDIKIKNSNITDQIIGKAFIIYDSLTITMKELIETMNKIESLKLIDLSTDLTFHFVFENFDLLNQTMTWNLIDSITKAEENFTFKSEKLIEVNNFIRLRHLEEEGGLALMNRCVRQSIKNTIGAAKWRENIYACLDMTKKEVSEWYVQLISNHLINNITKYFSFAGGDASSLPVLPNLDVPNSQINFYLTFYARTVASIGKSVLIDVAYDTDDLPNFYINLASSPNQVRSLIPLILSTSLQGYSKLALTLINYTMPDSSSRVCNCDPLYTWLELAMFIPTYRIPAEILNWNEYGDILYRYRPLRKLIMDHYRHALSMNRLYNHPIYKPIWWMDYKDYRNGKYSSDQEKIWANNRQFMIGDNLLVAAFLQADGNEQPVYLPPGLWRNPETKTGTTMQGGKFIYIDTGQNVACFERCFDRSVGGGKGGGGDNEIVCSSFFN